MNYASIVSQIPLIIRLEVEKEEQGSKCIGRNEAKSLSACTDMQMSERVDVCTWSSAKYEPPKV